MADFAPYQNLDFAFARLFESLSKSWPNSDVEYVRELVSHAEYGEAIENLIAIGTNKGVPFAPDQHRMVAELSSKMGLDTSSLERAAGARSSAA